MTIKSTSRTLQNLKTDCLCVCIFEDRPLTPEQKEFDILNAKVLTKVLKSNDFQGKIGETYLLPGYPTRKTKHILLIGLGQYETFNGDDFHRVLETLFKQVETLAIGDCVVNINFHKCPLINLNWIIPYFSEFLIKRTYRFKDLAHQYFPDIYSQKNQTSLNLNNIEFRLRVPAENINLSKADNLLNTGLLVGHGANTAKFLGDLPANLCNPSFVAQFCKQLAEQHDNLECRVLEHEDLEELHMNALLSVAAGSSESAKLVEICYQPKTMNDQGRVCLIGKGVTFDTGGISLKPSTTMDEMKYDMCGAASVVGVMETIAKSGLCQSEVIGILVLTENMPSGSATKPGDVIKSMSGQTIEVLNTDAEGRLILADALTYAQTHHQPDVMIDIATLTGACVVALGKQRSGLMSNSDALANSLVDTGNHTLDRCWQLPLDDDYATGLKSHFADMANIASGRSAGTIVGGKFLQKFVNSAVQWAHLDIAGTAWISGEKKGATGRPVSLLTNWLFHHHSLASQSVKAGANKQSKRGLIGPIIEQGLLNGDSTDTILADIYRVAPMARTSASSITFYAHRLRKQGKPIPLRQRGRKKIIK